MIDFWVLKILMADGHLFEVCGTREVLQSAMDEWSSGEFDGGKITINGVYDSADRVEHIVVVKRETITGMSLLKRY